MMQILEWAGLGFIVLFILLDLVYRHQRYEAPRFWRLQALAVSVSSIAVATGVALVWGNLFAERSLLNLSSLGTWAGAAVGILVYELIHYGYHRLAHGWDPLWRWSHQMHHSAESLDAWGANYLSPLDTVFFTTASSLVFFPLLGLAPEAGLLGVTFLTFNAMFQHANIKTPRWVGYLIQRPESHSVHHAREVHQYNFSDLPLWDMVFGTFRNPEGWEREVGFYDGASRRIPEMLIGRDVTSPRPKAVPDAAAARAMASRNPDTEIVAV